MKFNETIIKNLVSEIRDEQQVSPALPDSNFVNYIKEGMYDINSSVGANIDYTIDLEARALLKNYVMYANYKRTAEFKELYIAEYVTLQFKYNADTDVS